jgi:hypothetical protein
MMVMGVMRDVRRNLREPLIPFEIPEKSFKDIFRFKKATAQYVVDILVPNLQATVRSTAIPPHSSE